MKIFVETPRLILREILPQDEDGMFELDSNPEVHRYLGNTPVKNIEEIREVIGYIHQQYINNGIGRWTVIEKETGNYLGWAGLKLMKEVTNGQVEYYDLGYRFIEKYWGKGFATEASKAMVKYGFEKMNLPHIYAMADAGNTGSKKVLEKSGLTYVEDFYLDDVLHAWYTISRKEWESQNIE